VIVAHFYDVESGRKDLGAKQAARTSGSTSGCRDGGIQNLLAEAERADRRFDAVIRWDGERRKA
jgi:hypothetical protein